MSEKQMTMQDHTQQKRNITDDIKIVDRPKTALWRIIVAFLYDLLILLALAVLLSAVFTLVFGIAYHETPAYKWGFDVTLLTMLMGYFALSWKAGGQTIGMKAWKLKVVREDTTSLHWSDIVSRLMAGLLNLCLLNLGWLGYLGATSASLTDRLSRTRIIRT
jgi:uncharacterized RDD family membrane protein YckC